MLTSSSSRIKWNNLHQACKWIKILDNRPATLYCQAGGSDANASWYLLDDWGGLKAWAKALILLTWQPRDLLLEPCNFTLNLFQNFVFPYFTQEQKSLNWNYRLLNLLNQDKKAENRNGIFLKSLCNNVMQWRYFSALKKKANILLSFFNFFTIKRSFKNSIVP